jgi:hypothetical protein
MTTELRKTSWRYRAVDAYGDPCEQIQTIRPTLLYAGGCTAEEAAEFAAAELHKRDNTDGKWPDDYPVGEIDGNGQLVEIECEPGVWRRFDVVCEVKLKYSVVEEIKP